MPSFRNGYGWRDCVRNISALLLLSHPSAMMRCMKNGALKHHSSARRPHRPHRPRSSGCTGLLCCYHCTCASGRSEQLAVFVLAVNHAARRRTSDRSGRTMRSNGEKLGPLRKNVVSRSLLYERLARSDALK
ncbi:hypothetical protein CC80DRAFT_311977 [Byssothecium circinans]|uniref:Uncharacterized protein n=1 Tax=Byssothecium circinans TaxID=147558 RepID=A0A6A5U7N3_9PLEO|nr:hypothetical protein CC80DRAFT_311977 [Byssothecium circinans]